MCDSGFGSYNQPNILFLRGCFLGDCDSIEDMFDKRIINESISKDLYDIKHIIYDKIPPVFTDVNSWLTSTNLKCWTCDRKFYNMPIFIPTALGGSSIPGKVCGHMDTLGNFCSWNCACSYINLFFKGRIKWERHEFLKLLYKIFTGDSIDEIIPSPPKVSMRQYGGMMLPDEYTKKIQSLNANYKTSVLHNCIDRITK